MWQLLLWETAKTVVLNRAFTCVYFSPRIRLSSAYMNFYIVPEHMLPRARVYRNYQQILYVIGLWEQTPMRENRSLLTNHTTLTASIHWFLCKGGVINSYLSRLLILDKLSVLLKTLPCLKAKVPFILWCVDSNPLRLLKSCTKCSCGWWSWGLVPAPSPKQIAVTCSMSLSLK